MILSLERARIRWGRWASCLAGILACAFAPGWQPARAAASLSVGPAQGAPGALVTVPILFAADATAVALQVDLRFDSAKLQFGSAAPGDSLAGHHLIVNDAPGGGLRIMIYSRTNAALRTGTLLTLPVLIDPAVSDGTLSLVLTNAIVADGTGISRPVTLASGSVIVSAAGPPRIVSIARPMPSEVDLVVGVSTGHSYQIQSSFDLKAWSILATNLAPNPPSWIFTDHSSSTAKQRFYRAALTQP